MPASSYYYLLLDVALFFILTLYFDQTIKNEYGVSRNPIFFLFPSYWGMGTKKSNLQDKAWLERVQSRSGGITVDGQDEAVVSERASALSDEYWPAIKLVNIRKVFQKYRVRKSKTDKIAVKDVSVTFSEGKLTALLGQNGAGKV